MGKPLHDRKGLKTKRSQINARGIPRRVKKNSQRFIASLIKKEKYVVTSKQHLKNRAMKSSPEPRFNPNKSSVKKEKHMEGLGLFPGGKAPSTSGTPKKKSPVSIPPKASPETPRTTEFNEKELNQWKEIIFREHTRLYDKYDEEIELVENDLFASNREKCTLLIKKRFTSTHNAVEFRMDPTSPIKSSLCHAKSIEKGGKTGGKAAPKTMSNVKAIPKMYAWLPTPQNISVEDQHSLTHIPVDTEADDAFVKELIEYYDWHVHGNGDGGFINDHILFKLLQSLKNHPQTPKSPDGELPDVAFKAMSEIFPDKGTWKELKREKYPDLQQRYDPEGFLAGMADFVTPSMDGPDAVATPRERSLHSFLSLWCSRCCQYDCFLHGPDGAPPTKKKKSEEELAEYRKEFPSKPCSETCHLHDSLLSVPANLSGSIIKPELLSPRKRKPSPRVCESLDVSTSSEKKSDVVWMPAEISMFRVYRGAYGDDYCAIAEGLRTLGKKTCRDVKELATKEGPMSPTAMCMSPSPIKSNKKSKSGQQDRHRRFRNMKWGAEDDQGQVSNRFPYTPCAHPPGVPCSPSNCHCAARQVLCMKFCKCSSNCSNRFPGCRCKAHCNTRQCPCFMAYRECDPDLCTSCGACDFSSSNPINCFNVALQRGQGKHLLMAPSDVSGWGMFVKDAVPKNGFISEYCGELISQEEADRRGKIYDRRKCSYLFNLNQEQAVDATRKGNKIRFANHSIHPNCYAKVLMVNGDHRIGIFAKDYIQEGEELFFDYRYRPGDKLKFVSIERPTAKL